MIRFDDRIEREQRASLCFADGLLDIGIGVGLLALGFLTALGLGAIAGVYLAALFPIVNALKRAVTMPRMHHLDFLPDAEAGRRAGRVRAVVSVSMGIMAALGVLAFFTSRIMPPSVSMWFRENAIAVFGLPFAVLFALLGWGTATGRMRLYAIITAAALVIGYWFDMSPAVFFVLLGAIVAAWGGTVIARFVHEYPRMSGSGGRIRTRSYRLASGRMDE